MSKGSKRKRVTLAAVDEFGDEWTFEIDRLTVAEWKETALMSDDAFVEASNLEMTAGPFGEQPADVLSKCILAASRFFRGAPPAAPRTKTD